MKYLITILLLLSSFKLFAEFSEISCKDSNVLVGMTIDGTSIQGMSYGKDCGFSLKPKDRNNRTYKSYSFDPEGFFSISFTPLKGAPGQKVYSLISEEQKKLKLFYDSETKTFKFQLSSGEEVFFDSKTGFVNTDKTTDLVIKDRPFSKRNDFSSFQIMKSKSLLVNFNANGSANSEPHIRDPLIKLERDGAKACKGLGVKPSKEILFKYKMPCRHLVSPSSKPECSCVNDIKLFNQCSTPLVEAELTNIKIVKAGFNSKGWVDGVTLRKDYKDILSQECSDSFNTEKKEVIKTVETALSKSKSATPPNIPDTVAVETPQIMIKTPTKDIDVEKIIKLPELDLPKVELPKMEPITYEKPPQKETVSIDDLPEDKVFLPEVITKKPEHDLTVEVAQLENYCIDLLKQFFKDLKNRPEAIDYLKAQGKITLHKIAWTYLAGTENNTKDIESTITKVLKERSPEAHKKFVNNAKDLTRNQRLLASIGELKKYGDKNLSSEENKNYLLQYSDLKMMDLLVKAEKVHGRGSKTGVMDFLSIINNSLKNRTQLKTQNKNISENILDQMQGINKDFDKRVSTLLKENDCERVYKGQSCIDEDGNPYENLSLFMKLQDKVLAELLEDISESFNSENKEDDLGYQSFKWNNYWLKVTKEKNPQ